MDLRGLGLSEDDLKALGYDVLEAAEEGQDGGPPTRAEGRSRTLGRWVWTLLVLLIAGWGTSSARHLPSPVPANRPDTVFSSGRAMSQLVEIARRPRPQGSPEHARVRTYLVERFRALGLDPQVQVSMPVYRSPGFIHAFTRRSLTVRIPGMASTGGVALVAHYDSHPLSPGAGDDGVGVAAILETARALVSGSRLPNDIVILLADGGASEFPEEGARDLERTLPEDVRLVISADMLGVKGPVLTFESLPRNGRLVDGLASSSDRTVATSLTRVLPTPSSIGGGSPPSNNEGVPWIRLTSLGARAFHAQVMDQAERVDERTLEHLGSHLLSLARGFGRVDLREGLEGREVEQVYLTLPGLGLLHHPSDWTSLLSLGLIGGWVLLSAFARYKGASYSGGVAGFLMTLGLLAGSAAIGWGLLEGTRDLHPEYGALDSAYFRDDLHYLALVALVVTLVVGAYGAARRRFKRDALVLGALGVPVALAAWWGFRAPAGAMALQWAVASSLLSVLLGVAFSGHVRSRPWVWGGVLILAAGSMAILVPNLEILAATLTLRGAAWMGPAIAIALVLILPALEYLRRPHAWWLPALALCGGVGFVLLAMPAVQGDERHPTISSLTYLVDGELTLPPDRPDATGIEPDSSSFRRVEGRWLTIPGSGEAWARSWVAEEEAEATDPGVLLLPEGGSFVLAGSGPETDMPFPSLRILADSVAEGGRRIELAIRSRLGAEMVGIHLPGNGCEIIGLGASVFPSGAGEPTIGRLTHWGVPDGGVLSVVLLARNTEDPLTLDVLEHHLRPREVLGEDFFRRDKSMIANAPAGSDRIIQRTRIYLPGPRDGAGS